ncbi:hypothetical protein ACQKKK_15995 [Peribacillus sp. NPDC006672]
MTKNKNNVEVRREPGAQYGIYMRVILEINAVGGVYEWQGK